MEGLDSKDMKLHMETYHVDRCHNVDNDEEWTRQQVVEDLHIMVNKSGYKDVGYPAPIKVKSVIEHGIADPLLDVMVISIDMAMKLGLTPMEALGGS